MTGGALILGRRAWKVPRRVQLLLGVVLVGVFAFGLCARADAGAARDKPTVLAVWGLADGDTDVAGATVRVFAGPPAARGGASRSGRALAQTNGRRADRTYRSGVALLAFRRLPSEFVVEVRGGRANGRRVPGTLRAAVRGYRSGDVIYVNPVTTMMAAYRAAVERGSLDRSYAGARRLAYRELRIPHWMSQADLSYRDRRFDGDTLSRRRAPRRRGRRARSPAPPRRPGRPPVYRVPAAARAAGGISPPPRREPLGPLPGGGAVLEGAAGVVMRLLVTGAALAAGEVAQRNQIEVPGWLLGLFGLGDAADEQFAEIRRLLTGLSAQVTRLQSDVNLAGFSALVHQTDRTTGQIDHANSQLVLLANMPSGDPTKRAFARTIVDYIGTNLLDAPEILNQNLGTRISLADNLIKSASRTLGQRKLFGPKSSAEVRGIYDYFAAYQVQLAMLLQEYYHAKPDVYNPTNAAANLERLRANVVSQADSLKPDVPENTVIDTKNREMWVTDLRDPEVPLRRLAFVGRGGFNWVREFRSGCGFRSGERTHRCRGRSLLRLGAANPGCLRAAHRGLERRLTFALAAQGGRLQRADPVGLRLQEVDQSRLRHQGPGARVAPGRQYLRSLLQPGGLQPPAVGRGHQLGVEVRRYPRGPHVQAQARPRPELLVVELNTRVLGLALTWPLPESSSCSRPRARRNRRGRRPGSRPRRRVGTSPAGSSSRGAASCTSSAAARVGPR